MRKIVKWFVLGMTCVMLLSLLGCGGEKKTEDKKEITAAGKVLSSGMKIKKADSVRAEINIDMNLISILGEVKGKAFIDMQYQKEPKILKDNITLDLGLLGNYDYQLYMEEDKEQDTYYLYTNNGSRWVKEKKDKEQEQSYNIMDILQFYTNEVKELRRSGEEEFSGVKAEKIEGILEGDAVLTIIQAYNVIEFSTESSGETLVLEESMFQDLGEIPVTFYIDKKTGYLLQCDMDITKAGKNLLSNILSQTQGITGSLMKGIELGELTLSIQNMEYNEGETLQIPKEAYGASEEEGRDLRQ